MIAQPNIQAQSNQPTHAMGRVITPVTVENLKDLLDVREGKLRDDQVRRAAVAEALVDTGARSLALPTSLIQQLGLTKMSTRPVMTSKGPSLSDTYAAVRLTIQGRDCTLDVTEVPDGVPVLIGQVPLELLDFVVDPKSQRLVGDPWHGGEHVLDMY
ncbi:MAG TPA: aspartyl protease family protein [Pirellulaceae bacterium]|nr:aspartyl protease family protein [Pirellulaceae bacterium]